MAEDNNSNNQSTPNSVPPVPSQEQKPEPPVSSAPAVSANPATPSTPPVPPTTPPESDNQQPVSTLYNDPNMDKVEEVYVEEKKGNKVVLILGVIVVLAIIGIGAAFAYQQFMGREEVQPTPAPQVASPSPEPPTQEVTPSPVNSEEAELQQLEFNEEELESEFQQIEQDLNEL